MVDIGGILGKGGYGRIWWILFQSFVYTIYGLVLFHICHIKRGRRCWMTMMHTHIYIYTYTYIYICAFLTVDDASMGVYVPVMFHLEVQTSGLKSLANASPLAESACIFAFSSDCQAHLAILIYDDCSANTASAGNEKNEAEVYERGTGAQTSSTDKESKVCTLQKRSNTPFCQR